MRVSHLRVHHGEVLFLSSGPGRGYPVFQVSRARRALGPFLLFFLSPLRVEGWAMTQPRHAEERGPMARAVRRYRRTLRIHVGPFPPFFPF